jgi:plastocyanin
MFDSYVLGQNQASINGVQITQMYPYFNSLYNMSINYPSTWSMNETDLTPEDRVNLIAEFVSPFDPYNDIYREYVQINRDDGIFYQADLNNYMQEAISSYQNTTSNFTLIDSSTSGLLSGQPAYSLTFTQVLNGEGLSEPITLKCFETGTLFNNTAYYITYIGQDEQFDKFFPIVKQMIDSFKIILPLSYKEDLMSSSTSSDLNSSIATFATTTGLFKSIDNVNETTFTSSASNLSSSNPIVPNNLTNSQTRLGNNTNTNTLGSKDVEIISPFNNNLQVDNTNENRAVNSINESSTVVGEKTSLPVLLSENNPVEKNKITEIQIRTIENNGIEEVEFVPNEIVVDLDSEVVWTNNHSSVHTVTSAKNSTFEDANTTTVTSDFPIFDSDYMNTGDKYSYNFTQPGRFDYFDKNDDSLKGTVFVKQAPKETPSGQDTNTSSLTLQSP